MAERNCETCIHRKEQGCEKWECEYKERKKKYIDADSFEEILEGRIGIVMERYGVNSSEAGIVGGTIKLLSLMPAADVVEVKHGKWIPVTYRYEFKDKEFPNTKIVWMDATEPDDIEGLKCSECGTIYDFTEARNWCSECGAKMTEEKD